MTIAKTLSVLVVHAPAMAGLALFRRQALPAFFTKLLARLGPVYIKLGQVISTREDILPPAYVEQFAQLRHNAPPASPASMKRVLERAFPDGLPVHFASFNPEPIAAGSVAHVYRARLKSNADVVAVKVLRPGVRKAIEGNFRLLTALVRLASWLSADVRSANILGIVEELRELLLTQTDLLTEAANLAEFGALFKGHKHVTVPRMYPGLSSAEVLVTEFVSGVEPYDYGKLNISPQLLAQRVDALLDDMVFIKGMCHADLHPGNFFWNNNGQIVLIDFGLVHRLAQIDRNHIMTFYFAILDGYYDFAAEYFLRHFVTGWLGDGKAIIAQVQAVIREQYAQSGGQPRFGVIFNQLLRLLAQQRLQLTAGYSKIFLTLVTVEGYLYKLDPAFDMMENARRKRIEMAEYASVPEAAERLVLEDFGTYSCGRFEAGFSPRQAYEARDNLVLDMLAVNAGSALLDVGCGRGNLLGKAAGRGAQALGITISRIEHETCKKRGLNTVWSSWEEYQSEKVDFPQADAISAIELLFHIGSLHENKSGLVDCRLPRFFDWAHQQLKPGGRLFLQELIIDQDFLHDARYAEQYNDITTRQPWLGFNTLEQIRHHAEARFRVVNILSHHGDLIQTFCFQKSQIELHRTALEKLVAPELFRYLEEQIDILIALARQGVLRLNRILLEKPVE